MKLLVLAILLLMTVSVFPQNPLPPPKLEPGVSQALARWRAAHYSDVRYKLNITLEKGAPLMKGEIEIRVKLTGEGAKNDLVLDWRTTSFAKDKAHPSANVVAVTEDRHLVLVEQYRHGVERTTLEIPGGMVDPEDPSPEAAARRELLEETGYAAETWLHIGTVDPNPAIQSNRCHTFLAVAARRVAEPSPDGLEELRVLLEPASAVPDLLRRGRIEHALVVAALMWWRLAEEDCRSDRSASGSDRLPRGR